ncbi:MAG: LysR family transcriptional regulator [Sphingomonadales bacterium]
MNRMVWEGIQEFLAVASSGSLSAAARELGVSQPTVGRRIEGLEKRLDAPLFLRTPQGLSLTETGEKILQHAELMSDEALAIERTVTGGQKGLSGAVAISMLEALGAGWLTQQLGKFYEQYPDISIQLMMQIQAADLLRREADIAVRLFRPSQLDLVTKKVGELAFGFYASKDYLKLHEVPKTMADLSQHAFVVPHQEVMRYVEQELHEMGLRFRHFSFRSNSMMALLNATRSGYGIGIHTCIVADQQTNLVRLFPNEALFVEEIWLTTHKDLRRSARIRVVLDFLIKLFESSQDALMGRPGSPPST